MYKRIALFVLVAIVLPVFAQVDWSSGKVYQDILDGSSGRTITIVPFPSSSSSSSASSSSSGSSIQWPVDPSGFTEIPSSGDTRVVYVSSSEGNDSNDCLSPANPCATLTTPGVWGKVRDGYPDHVLLKRGDVWASADMGGIKNGRSPTEPFVVSYYGDSGARPKLRKTGGAMYHKNIGLKYAWMVGIHFEAYKLDPSDPEFTGLDEQVTFKFLNDSEHILLEDNVFDYIELGIQKIGDLNPSHFVVRRNIFTGRYWNSSSESWAKRPSNIYADGYSHLLIEENVLDYGGWHPTVTGAGANKYNHNIYLQYTSDGNHTVVRNNIITRGGSHGAQMRSGGLAEGNFFGRNTIGLFMAHDDRDGYQDLPMQVIDNVVSENTSMVKGDNPCDHSPVTDICSAAVYGVELRADVEGPDYVYTGNVVSNTNIALGWNSIFGSLQIDSQNLGNAAYYSALSDNIEWHFESPTQGDGPSYIDPGRTLGDYNESLGGANSFDEFMSTVLNRPPGSWDEDYTAPAINAYIKAGYEVE